MAAPPLEGNLSMEGVWTSNFEKAKEFYDKHQHLSFPRGDPVEYARLAQWLTYQRHKSRSLTKNQIERIESINYTTTPVYRKKDDLSWEMQFSRLKQHLHEGRAMSHNLPLANWSSKQKRKSENGLLRKDRYERLRTPRNRFFFL